MRYQLGAEQCAQILRLVLPRVSQHGLAADPVTYAVWFEYLAGINPPLTAAMDQRLQADAPVDDEFVGTLFDAHVASANGERLEEIRAEVAEILRRAAESVSAADGQVAAYGESLRQAAPRLSEASTEQLADIVRNLGERTGQMQQVNSDLRQQLELNGSEMESLRRELDQVRREASTDPLTGLMNRKGFQAAVDDIMEDVELSAGPLSLIMVDIDFFKRVNDTYGHLLGDKVIKVVAQTILRCIKGGDSAGRFGGEEFAVLLPSTPLSGALVVAEHIRSAVERGRIRRNDTNETIGQVTVSAGVAVYRSGETQEELIDRADAALYAAKQSGRNRVCAEEQQAA